jgi:deoxyribodipyrimidine photo-lyase
MAERHGNALFRPEGLRGEGRAWRRDHDQFEHWIGGRTGEPFVDANMRELAHTGFMSNRGRQNVASYLAHDLSIDWTWGAEWFESVLIDYDVHSNWGNWAYVAGVGNDPRAGRRFDVRRQAEKYDRDGGYVRTWLDCATG